ncbi:MAG: hypothetical protein V4857_31205 [Pseudomonadota bacterium]
MQKTGFRSDDTVFVKTEKGRAEVAGRHHALSLRERSVLIFIDGKKDVAALAAINGAALPRQQLDEILAALAKLALVAPMAQPGAVGPALQLVPKAAPAPAKAVVPARAAFGLTHDAHVIGQVREFMAATARTHLGLLGAGVIERVGQAKDAAALMAVVGHWHMALQDSRQGAPFAAQHLEHVKSALRAEPGMLRQA